MNYFEAILLTIIFSTFTGLIIIASQLFIKWIFNIIKVKNGIFQKQRI
jgi:hypothetical protein